MAAETVAGSPSNPGKTALKDLCKLGVIGHRSQGAMPCLTPPYTDCQKAAGVTLAQRLTAAYRRFAGASQSQGSLGLYRAWEACPGTLGWSSGN